MSAWSRHLQGGRRRPDWGKGESASSSLRDLVSPARLTHIVDVGANPHDGGTPPYAAMLDEGLCHVIGFEPQHEALLTLQGAGGPNELYLPYAVGDGGSHTLKICRASGMTSMLEPKPLVLGLFPSLQSMAEVIERVPVDTRRLDDISEIEHLDLLKIDIQGGELSVFQHGQTKLAEAVAIQTEVSFMTWYENQSSFGEVDSELRLGVSMRCVAGEAPTDRDRKLATVSESVPDVAR